MAHVRGVGSVPGLECGDGGRSVRLTVTLPTAEGGAESRVGPITDTLGYLVAQVARLHRQRADELLGHIGLHVGQEMMLNALWTKEGVAQTELTRKMGVQPATVTNADAGRPGIKVPLFMECGRRKCCRT